MHVDSKTLREELRLKEASFPKSGSGTALEPVFVEWRKGDFDSKDERIGGFADKDNEGTF